MLRTLLLAAPLALGLSLGCEPAKTAGALPDPGPNAATVTFESNPPGASVVVDGVTVGAAPQTVKLKPGPHSVRARKSGYFAQDQKITVTARESKTMTLTLVASH